MKQEEGELSLQKAHKRYNKIGTLIIKRELAFNGKCQSIKENFFLFKSKYRYVIYRENNYCTCLDFLETVGIYAKQSEIVKALGDHFASIRRQACIEAL